MFAHSPAQPGPSPESKLSAKLEPSSLQPGTRRQWGRTAPTEGVHFSTAPHPGADRAAEAVDDDGHIDRARAEEKVKDELQDEHESQSQSQSQSDTEEQRMTLYDEMNAIAARAREEARAGERGA
ncbi:uncharacterized protein HMPREF1541_07743 [Cyphellophora europaea CBS 101466]|uniref:Uncharacterized protein n=1 Tax=Cyphellophora europaea (strain CBS 101466) TaxID=1220924 RepID=W2RQW6_CYPE1|nr:uncharacterized protein HMPREF1541_07743 [Cyphellophora europaea CBS 101466]ETN38119.1 hypothetical protein HMPREF1541_07743 [Cyphellophora europaea CBS 101466]